MNENRSASTEFEIRLLEGEDLEVRAAEGEQPSRLVGYAALYGVRSKELIPGFVEVVNPGAFRAALTGKTEVRALIDHEPSKILGRTGNGTLRLSEDQRGLKVEIDVPDVSYGRDILTLVQRKDVRGMSFGFKVPPGGEQFRSDGKLTVRTLTNIDLREVTVTSIPAYPNNTLAVRVDPELAARAASAEKSSHPLLSIARAKLLITEIERA